jgi:hypothetical protein
VSTSPTIRLSGRHWCPAYGNGGSSAVEEIPNPDKS